jgi:hypothetical protein
MALFSRLGSEATFSTISRAFTKAVYFTHNAWIGGLRQFAIQCVRPWSIVPVMEASRCSCSHARTCQQPERYCHRGHSDC